MQESDDKERDWYGYAKYLESKIEEAAQDMGIICNNIGSFAHKAAADGGSIHLQFCEALSQIRKVHDSILDIAVRLNKIKGESE